jgi:predicted metal-dependent peptidase
MTPEQRLTKCTLSIITHKKYRTLGGVVMMGKTLLSDVPTACTDGFNVEYGEEFIKTLTDPELRFAILHENLHKALRHLSTWRGLWKENPQLANMACDYVINLMIMDSDAGEGFVQLPKLGLYDPKYRGMDAGEVYRLLKKDPPPSGGKQGFDQHDWTGQETLTEEEAAAQAKEVESAIRQGGVVAGKLSETMDRQVRASIEPEVRWEDELREYVMTLCKGRDISTWRRPNRRAIDRGDYLPSMYSETLGRIVVGTDTSGSIQGPVLSKFIAEVVSLATVLNPELLDLLYWDTHVAAHEKYNQYEYEQMRDSTKPKGGGGTNPMCVSDYLLKERIQPECVIMLTDGYVPNWGRGWTCPVVWCIVNNKRAVPTVGKAIYINTEV